MGAPDGIRLRLLPLALAALSRTGQFASLPVAPLKNSPLIVSVTICCLSRAESSPASAPRGRHNHPDAADNMPIH